jgi:hypothetical protein
MRAATTGEAVVNSATGERIVLQELERGTAGALVRGDGFLSRGVSVRGRHVHPNRE